LLYFSEVGKPTRGSAGVSPPTARLWLSTPSGPFAPNTAGRNHPPIMLSCRKSR
jgi:hypothetical protein